MPSIRNDNASQNIPTLTGFDTFVKENYALSPKQATLYMQVTKDPTMKQIPEFVFQGKRTPAKPNQSEPTNDYSVFSIIRSEGRPIKRWLYFYWN